MLQRLDCDRERWKEKETVEMFRVSHSMSSYNDSPMYPPNPRRCAEQNIQTLSISAAGTMCIRVRRETVSNFQELPFGATAQSNLQRGTVSSLTQLCPFNDTPSLNAASEGERQVFRPARRTLNVTFPRQGS